MRLVDADNFEYMKELDFTSYIPSGCNDTFDDGFRYALSAIDSAETVKYVVAVPVDMVVGMDSRAEDGYPIIKPATVREVLEKVTDWGD